MVFLLSTKQVSQPTQQQYLFFSAKKCQIFSIECFHVCRLWITFLLCVAFLRPFESTQVTFNFAYNMKYNICMYICNYITICFTTIFITIQVVPKHINTCLGCFCINFITWCYVAPLMSQLYLHLSVTKQFGDQLNIEIACCLVIHGVVSLFTLYQLWYYPSYSMSPR